MRRGVLAFDIAGDIPADATIDSVQLRLVVTKAAQSNGFPVSLHRVLADWGEGTSNTGNSRQGRGDTPTSGDATWHHTFFPGSFWTNPGGDYSLTESATTSVGRSDPYTWGSTSAMVADVQFWLDNPGANYGAVVKAYLHYSTISYSFWSSEGPLPWFRPQLVIEYE